MTQSHPEHDPDCARQLMFRVDHEKEHAYVFTSRSNRWSCPACLCTKFVKSVQHLMSLPALSMGRVRATSEHVERAKDMGYGYFIIHLSDGRQLFVSTPEAFPQGVVQDAPEVVFGLCLEWMLMDGVTRLVIGDDWKHEDETTEQSVCYARVSTFRQARDIAIDAGFIPVGPNIYDIGQYRPDDAYERLLMTIDEHTYDP